MIKFSPSGNHTLCDRCRRILATCFNRLIGTPTWEFMDVPAKGSEGKLYRYDFCDERCRIIYFRGRKYYQRKLQHIDRNVKEQLTIDWLRGMEPESGP